jgi:hypothetical protein
MADDRNEERDEKRAVGYLKKGAKRLSASARPQEAKREEIRMAKRGGE